MTSRVLVVEDDPKMGQHLVDSLSREGLIAMLATDRPELEDMFASGRAFDVVILDRLLGTVDSKSYVPQIKRVWPESRILVLSAINTPNERTELLKMGTDDYVGKPFSTQEVLARVSVLLRRGSSAPPNFLKYGNTVIDLIRRTISAGGRETPVPAKEFLLLKSLLGAPGQVFNKNELLDIIWGASPDAETNVVEATVTNARRRLEDIGSDLEIRNMRNAGYWIED